MDILTIKYFLSVARCLNFSQAAEENHISQSSFSKAIMRLEKELNVKLIDRRNHPVALTPAGKCLYEHMSVLEPQFKRAMEAMENMVRGETLHLLICPNSYQYKLAFDAYQKKHTDVRLHVEYNKDISKITEEACSGKYDFVISPQPLDTDDTIQITPLYNDELYLLTSDRSVFAKMESVSLKALNGLDFYQSTYSKHLLYALSRHFHFRPGTVQPQEGIEMRREEGIHRITLSNGVGLYAGRDLAPYRTAYVRAVPIQEMPNFPVVMLEQKDKKDSPAKQCFRRWMLANFESFITPRMNIEEFNHGSSQ